MLIEILKMEKIDKIYVIEGVDSCGKTTICKELSKRNKWIYISTPSGIFKKHIRQIERLKDNYLSFIYFLSSVFHTSYLIRKEIEKKNIIICDRYYPTLKAYSKAINMFQDFINLKKLPIIKPTKIIHLYVDYQKIKERLEHKKNCSLDELLIIKNKKFYNDLVREYRKECDIEIDATNLSIEKIVKKIQEILK